MRHMLIDTDTASDDAVALVMALLYPDVQVEAITVVAGNVPLDQGVQNALYTVELCQKQAFPCTFMKCQREKGTARCRVS